MYQRAVVQKFGDASDVVELENTDFLPLAAGSVRIRMVARSINPSDLITISGAYRSRTTLPFIPGFEGVGIVEELGADVLNLSKGDRVVPIGEAGTWQDFKDADAEWCLQVPDQLTDEQAAMSYVNPMTAWIMLHKMAEIGPGTQIAITAAGSAIGRMMVRIANAAGVVPTVFVRNEQSASRLSGMSAVIVICKTEDEYVSAIESLSSDGLVDVVFDSVGGPGAIILAKILRNKGQFIHYGLLSGEAIPFEFRSIRPDIRFSLFHLRSWMREVPLAKVHHTFATVASLLAEGQIESDVRSSYSLNQISNALRDAKNLSSSGKVIIAH